MSQTKARKSRKDGKDCCVAKVSSKISNCIFCNRSTDDEVIFGKLYDIADISCHYFCALLSSCLVQNGNDEDGLFGFLYSDIVAEAQRGRKYKCSYCSRGGATLGCNIAQCKKQFHLPCGREHNAVSLFYGNYKTFCNKHAPKQKIPDQIMVKANQRLKADNRLKRRKGTGNQETNAIEDLEEVACVICYETVPGYPSTETFWPSCCGKDAWFHRTCLQRMSLASGMHYLKCPLCNDKDDFYRAVLQQGYYVPDRDAAWELETNAFAEIYQRPAECSAAECRCCLGREHDADSGIWELKLCLLCGSSCVHGGCLPEQQSGHYVCTLCQTVEPPDLDKLAAAAVAVASTTQDESTRPVRRGPPVPARMSLRRTKRNCTSASVRRTTYDPVTLSYVPEGNTNSAPLAECIENEPLKDLSNIMSPTKLIEDSLKDKIMQMDIQDMSVADTRNLIEEVREKFKKPRPLSAKRMVVSHILENLLNKMPDVNTKIQDEIVTSQSDATQIPDVNECKTESDQDAKKEGDIMDTEGNAPIKDEIYEAPSASNVVLNDGSEDKNDINNLEQDEDTKSTFELPSEFVADCNSDVSLEAFDTSKRLKTLSIDNNSAIEISEKNEGVNIDIFEMHTDIDPKSDTKSGNVPKFVKDPKCTLKFSLLDEKILHNSNVDIDLEVFKNQYLNEVDRRSYKCPFSHRHEEDNETAHTTIRSVIDFAIDAAVKKYHRENGYDVNANDGSQRPSKPIKRKLDEENENDEGVKVKLLENENKQWSEKTYFKVSKIGEPERSAHCSTKQNVDLNGSKSRRNKIKRNKHLKKLKKSTECNEIIDLTKESNRVRRMRRKKRDKEKRRNSMRRKKLKIKLMKKTEKNDSKKNGKPSAEKENQKILKQTVLMFGSNDRLLKSPIKTKTKKTKSNIKSPDNLRQMSLDNFFVLKIPV